jgi:hypothetical protein
MKKKNFIIAAVVVFSALFAAVSGHPLMADCASSVTDCNVSSGSNDANGGGQTKKPLFGSYCASTEKGQEGKNVGDPGKDGCAAGSEKTDGIVSGVIKIMMYIIGIISVIMIIAGGIMYATASGDEAKTKKARTAIVGALIGLVFAILAWTLTNFVLSALSF